MTDVSEMDRPSSREEVLNMLESIPTPPQQNVVQHPAMAQDRNEARNYINWLTGDPNAAVTFQTFDDNADRKDRQLAHVLNGTLEQHWAELVTLNNAGAGVFVTVNETNLQGRKNTDIVRIRAVWQEDDDGFQGEYPLLPHIVVQSSPGKFHRYWLSNSAPSEGLDEHEGVEQCLVNRYGSDKNAADIGRVLRVPGFYHLKVNAKKGLTGVPHMVRALELNGHPRFPWYQIKEAFPPEGKKRPSLNARSLTSTQNASVSSDAATPESTLEFAINEQIWNDLWSALQVINGAERETWIAVGHALKTIPDDKGWALFHDWSKNNDGYVDESDCLRTWHSFKPTDTHWKAIFKIAKESGWVNPRSIQGQTQSARQYALQAIESGQQITREQVGAADLDAGEEWIVHAYREQEREKFNRVHGLVMVSGKATVIYRKRNANTDQIESEFSSSDSVGQFYRNQKLPEAIQDKEGRKYVKWSVSVFQDWFDRHDRRSYKQVSFEPVPDMVAEVEMPAPVKGNAYNLYVGSNFAPRQGSTELIRRHIFNVWCRRDEEVYWYVIRWMARMVQYPQKQGSTVIVIRSGQGVGKNIIIDIFDRYFGVHSNMLTRPEDLGGFNDHLGSAVFTFLNEAVWGGDKKLEGTIKSVITDDYLFVERKYLPKFKTRNCNHIMIATNADWAVPMGIDDRRFFVLDPDESLKNDPAYFRPLVEEIDNGGREAFIWYLLHDVDVTQFNVRQMPQNSSATKLDHKIRSADSITQWWIDALTEGGFEVQESISTNFMPWSVDEEFSISRSSFHSSYASSVRGPHRERKPSVTLKVQELLGVKKLKVVRPRAQSSAPRERHFVLPPLREARAAMDKHLKQPGPWHDEEDSEQPSDATPTRLVTGTCLVGLVTLGGPASITVGPRIIT